MQDKIKVHDAISKLLNAKLSTYSSEGATLNPLTCTKIYQDIFNCLVSVFQGANINITNEAMNYLAQQYYDAVTINNNQELDPNIFSQRSKLDNIETKELAILAAILNGTPFVFPIVAEIKKRS